MNKFRNSFLTAFFIAVFHIGSASAELVVGIENAYRQDRISADVEDLDTEDYEATGYSSSWSAVKKLRIYQIGAYSIWEDKCSHIFAHIRGRYGWMLSGTNVSYPLHWDIDGHTADILAEVGYVYNICDCFDFIPLIGYSYDSIHYKITNQHFGHTAPIDYIDRSGNKYNLILYAPYIGFNFRFDTCLCNRYNINILTGYEFHYGSGRGKVTVPEFILTNDPNTSNYGSHTKFRNVITHEFHIYGDYAINNCWSVGLGFEYYATYNTHKNRLRLQHNDEIVDEGQFTPTQYHVYNNLYYQSYLVNLVLTYHF